METLVPHAPDRWPDAGRLPTARPGARILVIEDDGDIADALRSHLEHAGHSVTVSADGTDGLALAGRGGYDLLIVDLMLPGLDGYEVCRRLRDRSESLPILILTARASERERVRGLELGADDYLTKPFGMSELLARVKALLRRAAPAVDGRRCLQPVVLGGLVIDAASRSASLRGQQLVLTAKEFDLLHWFARRPGRVFRRGELLDAVWGHDSESLEHTVSTHLNRLRSKIEPDPSRPSILVTVRGVGYKIATP